MWGYSVPVCRGRWSGWLTWPDESQTAAQMCRIVWNRTETVWGLMGVLDDGSSEPGGDGLVTDGCVGSSGTGLRRSGRLLGVWDRREPG